MHWNPITVILVGFCIGLAVAIPLLDLLGENSLVYRWQSMIGAVVSAGLAIGLFQYQRYLDKRKEEKGYIFTVIRSLKRITNHSENVRIATAIVTLKHCQTRCKTVTGRMNMPEVMKEAAGALAEVIIVHGKYSEILTSIPRDKEIAGEIVADIDKIDDSINQIILDLRIIYDRTTGNWGELKEDGVPAAIHEALSLLQDINAPQEAINAVLRNLENKSS